MFLKLTEILVSTLVFIGAVQFCSAWDISSSGVASSSHCARIYMQRDFKGPSFFLKDKEQVPFMRDMQGWNETSQISVKVKPSCTANIASQPFLQGDQHNLFQDTEEFQFEGEEAASFQNSSISCLCHKSCSCNDVVFRGRECARGYLDSDCTDCDAVYTSFKQGERVAYHLDTKFPVQSFVVRPTCKLNVEYRSELDGALETVDIQTNTKSEIVPFSGFISSTSCKCNTRKPGYRSPARKASPSDPPLLSISNLRGQINAELKKPGQENHPGLLAALQSLRGRRSPKNAYILLLGLTGSGKSTAINLLFDHPNITQVGSAHSTTTDIHEFRIPVEIPEMGIQNSELRIIDTPGIADTRGTTHDARFLATLDQYLTRHEDLKKSVPNLILIVTKFDDNRFEGEKSSFVKMLKTIELFRNRLVDPKFSNIIFVLTHFMSETKDLQKTPGPKIEQMKSVIEEYTSLPKPVVLVVAENKPELSELPSLNGYWALPNGDHYPKNLFDQMQRTLSSCGDPIGLGIIQTAFSHSDEFKIEGKTFPLLPSTQKNVVKYFGLLADLELPPKPSEVSETLDSAYEELSGELKSRYSKVLNHLKRVFAQKKITELSKIPRTPAKIVEFLKDVQINEASLFLLERAFNLELPVYSQASVVGSGYDLVNDKTLGIPIFNLSSGFYPSEMGYQLPGNVKVSLSSVMRNVFGILQSRNEYVETRLVNLGLGQESRGLENLLSSEGGKKAGLNIVTSPDENDLKLSALIEYQTFGIVLDKESTLSEGYLRDLRALGSFDASSFESVRAWNEFFLVYGTHAVVGGSGGGSIEIEVKMKDFYYGTQQQNVTTTVEPFLDENFDYEEFLRQNEEYESANEQLESQVSSVDRFTRLSQTMSLILQYLANNFLGKETPVVIPEGMTYSIRMRGGDSKFYVSNITHHSSGNGESAEIWHILDKWQTSVHQEPEILTSYFKLIPMSEILQNIPGLEPEVAEAMGEAARAFLNASLVYVPSVVVDNSLGDRDHSGATTQKVGDFQSLQVFARVFESIAALSEKNEDRFRNMMLEVHRENQRQNALYEERLKAERELEMRRLDELREEERYRKATEERRLQLELEREKEERAAQAALHSAEAARRAKQTAQLVEMRARNQQAQMEMIAEQNRQQHELALAEMTKESLLDKTFKFIGRRLESISSQLVQAAPIVAAALG